MFLDLLLSHHFFGPANIRSHLEQGYWQTSKPCILSKEESWGRSLHFQGHLCPSPHPSPRPSPCSTAFLTDIPEIVLQRTGKELELKPKQESSASVSPAQPLSPQVTDLATKSQGFPHPTPTQGPNCVPIFCITCCRASAAPLNVRILSPSKGP